METRAPTTCRRTCLDEGRRSLRRGKKDEFLQWSTCNEHVVPWRARQPHRRVEDDRCEAKRQQPVGTILHAAGNGTCMQHERPPSHRSGARDLVLDKLDTSAGRYADAVREFQRAGSDIQNTMRNLAGPFFGFASGGGWDSFRVHSHAWMLSASPLVAQNPDMTMPSTFLHCRSFPSLSDPREQCARFHVHPLYVRVLEVPSRHALQAQDGCAGAILLALTYEDGRESSRVCHPKQNARQARAPIHQARSPVSILGVPPRLSTASTFAWLVSHLPNSNIDSGFCSTSLSLPISALTLLSPLSTPRRQPRCNTSSRSAVGHACLVQAGARTEPSYAAICTYFRSVPAPCVMSCVADPTTKRRECDDAVQASATGKDRRSIRSFCGPRTVPVRGRTVRETSVGWTQASRVVLDGCSNCHAWWKETPQPKEEDQEAPSRMGDVSDGTYEDGKRQA